VASVALKSGHYWTNINSGVGHPRSDSVVPLVLCTVVRNGLGIDIVLQVPWDNANSVEKGNISSRLYMIVMTYN
jgi:hypothetical protein